MKRQIRIVIIILVAFILASSITNTILAAPIKKLAVKMDENAEPFWKDVDISDNIISMSGFTWGNTQGTQGYPMGSGLDITEHPNINCNLRIHDNLFLGSYGWMFICQLPDKNRPEIYNNTFCTLTMSSLPFINRNYTQYPAGQTEKYMSTIFGNKTNKVIVIN